MSPFVGTYWGPRAADRSECAGRLARFLADIAPLHPTLGQWHRLGRSATPRPFSSDANTIARLLKQNYSDIPRRPMPDLGYSLGAWNGVDSDFGIALGAAQGITSSRLLNCVFLRFGNGYAELGDVLVAVASAARSVFDPDDVRMFRRDFDVPDGSTILDILADYVYRRP